MRVRARCAPAPIAGGPHLVADAETHPLIRSGERQDVPLSRLQRATGLSLRYVSLIRRGREDPHPRHWAAFVQTAAPSAEPRHGQA
jgi:hypothetical protein